VCVLVCVRESESDVCVCVCVRATDRESARKVEGVCAFVCERESV